MSIRVKLVKSLYKSNGKGGEFRELTVRNNLFKTEKEAADYVQDKLHDLPKDFFIRINTENY